MVTSFLSVLTDPAGFFQDLVTGEVNLKVPAVIVLVTGIVAGVYALLIGNLTAEMMASLSPGIGSIIAVSAVAGALLLIFLFWIIWAAAMFGISAVLNGKGSFSRTLEVVGYGYIPQLFGTLVTILLAFVYLPRVRVPHVAASPDTQAIMTAVTQLMKDPAMAELTLISSIIGVIFLIWSANIWIFGIKNARGLTTRNAAITVLIPVLVMAAYSLFKGTGM